jgi:flavin-dependent dehydrogenase
VVRCDVIITGAGVAGAVAGYVLARLGHDTLIIGEPQQPRPGEVLAAGAGAMLERLQLHALLDDAFHAPCRPIPANDRHRPSPEFIIDREKFDSDLIAASVEAGAKYIPGEIRHIVQDRNERQLIVRAQTIHGPLEVAAGFVIDATGRKAAVARRCGASRRVLTNLVAAWARLPMAAVNSEPGTFNVEADHERWWYVAVGKRGAAAAVLGRHPPRQAQAWLEAARGTMLLRHLSLSTPVKPLPFAANISLLDRLCGDRWAAAGDAAATFDPLCGYGLTFAIGTGYAAARAADARLAGDSMASVAYAELVGHRAAQAWSGVMEAYEGLAAFPICLSSQYRTSARRSRSRRSP